MIHQTYKDAYYRFMLPASRALKPLYKIRFSMTRNKPRKLHIGCGRNYLEGFINLDANFQRKVDFLFDARAGLPFPDESFDFIYSCHMLEHLHVDESIRMLRELCRVLAPAGYARLSVPDFNYIFTILKGEDECSYPRAFKSREGQAINFLFVDGQHKYAYSRGLIEELAGDAGFASVELASEIDPNLNGSGIQEPQGTLSVNLRR